MCVRCKGTTKRMCVFGCGTFFVVIALIVGFLWPMIAQKILHSQFQLKEGSLNYDNWIVTPIPMYLSFTLFNWTNPHLMKTANYTPNFVEMGPYVFHEKHERVNVTFNRDNDTVSFYQKRTWHFEPDMSEGSLDDKVTNVDTILASVANNLRHRNIVERELSKVILRQFKSKLYITRTVRELLFDGYYDTLLTALKTIPAKYGIVVPPFNKFGWFVDRNESITYDGQFEMYAGQTTQFAHMGSLTKWNYSNKTRFYRDDCSSVKGTSGELWPMDMEPKSDISLFITDLCRPLTLTYQENHQRYDIVGSRWVGDYRVFDNGERYAPNKCFCPDKKQSCPELPTGVHDMSECRYEAPLFASFPHFYMADESYVKSISGVKPNQSLHEFSISLEPKTGVPLDIDAKLQINTFIQPVQGVWLHEDLPKKIMAPQFWFAQTAQLDEHLARETKIALQLPTIGTYLAIGIGGLGSILLSVGLIATVTKSWNNYSNLVEEDDNDENSDTMTGSTDSTATASTQLQT